MRVVVLLFHFLLCGYFSSLLSDVSASLLLSVLIRLTPERPPVAFLKKRNKVKQICNTFHRYLICLLNFPPPEFLARKRG